MSKLSERMVRLLNMVPYLRAHPGVSPDKAAADLGLTKKQLLADLDSLFFDCGLPGHAGGDLIDLAISEDALSVHFTAGMDRPLRLTSSEAAAVLVALQALAELPGLVDPAAARSAMVKIEAVNAEAGSAAPTPPEPESAETPAVAAIRTAVQQHRALAIDYYSASRDATSHRVVDPIRVVVIASTSYLEAWCRTAESVRLFRFDRVDSAAVLDEPAAPPDPALRAATDTSLFDADPSLPSATLLLEPSAFWMFDYHPMKLLAERADGSREASITYASDEWMTRLVLGFGSAVRVLAPASLATQVRDAAAAAVAAYQAH
ncbi:helix-turn-helix transcriptional regulator [[Mycobacterium] crassicus]|uniref:YafY family protein n=1 Tax=[Mycobacterium] crassicus TaxID=2872309 RepID=A0ABU5XIH5_9MYCO|nr:YafY family protein [Mycolicibacter sp. MYC098]MEB3021924.1 YafY family protein [Mycolicibacter sp. MYC098]